MGIKAGVYDSWGIINDTMVIKRTDKSFLYIEVQLFQKS